MAKGTYQAWREPEELLLPEGWARADLSDFTAQTGGQASGIRTMVQGFGRSQAGKAAWAARKQQAALAAQQEAVYHKQQEIIRLIRSSETKKEFAVADEVIGGGGGPGDRRRDRDPAVRHPLRQEGDPCGPGKGG